MEYTIIEAKHGYIIQSQHRSRNPGSYEEKIPAWAYSTLDEALAGLKELMTEKKDASHDKN